MSDELALLKINAQLEAAEARAGQSKHRITVRAIDNDGTPVIEINGSRRVREDIVAVADREVTIGEALLKPSLIFDAINEVERDLDVFYVPEP